MQVVLLEVGASREGPAWDWWIDGCGRWAMPAVGLVSLASLVRPHDEVRIFDEKVAPLPDQIEADVVGISFKTMYAKRAYAIADDLRARGVRVVLGGIHATIQPDDAMPHADVVVVGEGETVWRQVLDDIEHGRHQRKYEAAPGGRSLALPPQRFDLIPHERYLMHAVQSARGCSFDCEFCPTRPIFGEGYRLREVDTVVSEVKHLLDLDDKPVLFTENVFGAGDLRFISALTERLHSLSARYAVVCDWFSVTRDLARTLARNRCHLVGINLTGRDDPKEVEAIHAIHDAGLPIWGYFMFGFEGDTPDVFKRAVDRARRYELVCATLTVLAPYAGTPMGSRLASEGRVSDRDTDLYDQAHVVFQPSGMSATQLREGFRQACEELQDITHFSNALEAMAPAQSK